MITIHEEKTQYGFIEIKDDKRQRGLFIDGVCQGRMDLFTREAKSPYMRTIFHLVRKWCGNGDKILILGGGAFLLPAMLERESNYNILVVEQNKRLGELALEFFGYLPNKVVYEDAEQYINSCINESHNLYKNEVVILDLFNGDKKPPIDVDLLMKYCLFNYGIFLDNRFTDGVTFRVKE